MLLLKFISRMQKYKTRSIRIDKNRFTAIVADTTMKRMIGLMFRKKLNKRECMLFIFESEGFHSIWMHNMLFAIDVVWLDGKSRPADMVENIKPCKSILNCSDYAPKKAAKYIIEFNAGSIKRNRTTKQSRFILH